MINIRDAFKDSKVLFLATWEEGLSYMALYFLGLAPFLSFKGIDALALPWMTRDFMLHKKA